MKAKIAYALSPEARLTSLVAVGVVVIFETILKGFTNFKVLFIFRTFFQSVSISSACEQKISMASENQVLNLNQLLSNRRMVSQLRLPSLHSSTPLLSSLLFLSSPLLSSLIKMLTLLLVGFSHR